MFDLNPHITPDSDGKPGLGDQSFQQQARLLVAGRLLSPEGSETFKRIVAHDIPVSLTPMRLLFELHREISELGKQANYPGSIDRLLNSLALTGCGKIANLG